MEACICCGSDERESLERNRFFAGVEIVRCRGCGLVYQYPRPPREVVDHYYRESYYRFGSLAGPLARLLKLYYSGLRARNQFAWIKGGLDSGRTGRVLEVGCGYGRLLALFAREGWEVAGIEPGADCARYTAGKFARAGGRVFHGTFEDFRPAGEQYDLIVLSHVFEHFIAPEEVIERLGGMLAPGGALFFELPNGEAAHYRETRYRRIPDFYFFSARNFGTFIRKHGLKLALAKQIEYRRLLARYDTVGHLVNYAWWAVLDLFGGTCFREAGTDSIWLRALVRKPVNPNPEF